MGNFFSNDTDFTFNTLNAISSKILKGNRLEAYDLMTDFSSMMRSVMNFSEDEDWSLTEELKFTNLYLQFMKERFKNLFSFAVNIDKSVFSDEIIIPKLLIQNFIENTIKHIYIDKNCSIKINIEVKNINQNIEIKITDLSNYYEKEIPNSKILHSKTNLRKHLNISQIEQYNKLHKTSIHFKFEHVKSKNNKKTHFVSIFIPIKV